MNRCPQCGKEWPEDYQFCLEDATRLVLVVPAMTASAIAATVPETSGARSGRPVGVIVGALTALIAVCGMAWQHVHSQAGASVPPLYAGIAAPPSASTQQSQASNTVQPEASWQRYSNSALGISCDYQQDWQELRALSFNPPIQMCLF